METNQEWNTTGNQLVVDEEMKKSLSSIASWTTFLAIVAFVSLALTILAGILLLVSSLAASNMPEMYEYRSAIADAKTIMTISGIAYIVIGLIFFIPASKLYGAASAVKKAVGSNDNEALAKAFRNWKFVTKFYGWVVIISLLLMVAACVAGIAAGTRTYY